MNEGPQCPHTDEAGAAFDDVSADDLIIRASERIPLPVLGPDVISRSIEIVREETATRIQRLEGTLLDARMSRLPRAGTCLNIHTLDCMNVMK